MRQSPTPASVPTLSSLLLGLAALTAAPILASAQDNPAIRASRCRQDILAQSLQSYSAPVTAQNSVGHRQIPLTVEPGSRQQISFGRTRATMERATYSTGYPALRIRIQGERNDILVVDSKVRFFSWDQALVYGCQGLATSPQEAGYWALPRRDQRDLLRAMIQSPGFLEPMGSMRSPRGQLERVFGMHVMESSFERSLQCYGGSMNAYLFSETFFIDSPIGLTDRDQNSRANLVGSNQEVLPTLRNQAIQILLRYAFDQPIMGDPVSSRALEENLDREFGNRAKDAIKIAVRRAGGLANMEAAIQEVSALFDAGTLDWTRVYFDASFNRQLRERLLWDSNQTDVNRINRPHANGGGLRVYCVTEIPRQ